MTLRPAPIGRVVDVGTVGSGVAAAEATTDGRDLVTSDVGDV